MYAIAAILPSSRIRSLARAAALLLALAGMARGADEPIGVKPPSVGPRSKIASGIMPYLLAPTPTPIGPRLSRATGAAAGLVRVRLDAAPTPASLAAVTATGATVVGSSARWRTIIAEATPAQVDALAALAEVRKVGLARAPMHRYVNEGDAVMHTDTVRAGYGVSGAGMTIGVLSDSINRSAAVGAGTVTGSVPNAFLTKTTPQNTSNLAPSIQVIDFGPASGTDEGEAMLEEIYHVATGASLAFAAADTDQSIMADNISSLVSAAHCRIVCDDVAFFDEPFFQDGPIAQAADSFRAGGGLYFSAAGNDGPGMLATYTAVSDPASDPHSDGTPTTGAGFHNWGIGGAAPGMLPISIAYGEVVYFILQWNQPYQSYGLGAGSQADFDLYLYDSSGQLGTGHIVADGIDHQGTAGNPTGDPVEVIQYRNTTGSTLNGFLAIDHFAGITDARLRLIISQDNHGWSSPDAAQVLNTMSIYGHCAASGVAAVAAARYSSPTVPEFFTSWGGQGANGVPFYFDTAGNALANAPQLRNKPDITGPDGVSTSIADFTPFLGTSCATPNVAAAAALVWQANPHLANGQVLARLEATATDITAAPASSGPDAITGAGMVDALAASRGLAIGVASADGSGAYENGSIPIQVAFSGPITLTGSPTLSLNTAPARTATCTGLVDDHTLGFTYAIHAGDQDAALDVLALNLNGGAVVDADGQACLLALPAAGASGSLSSAATIVIDAVGPSVTVSGPAATVTVPTIAFSIVFSRPVTGLTTSSFQLSGATALALTGSGDSYTLTVSATAIGTVAVSLAAGVATDAAGLGSLAGSGSVQFAPPPLTLSITAAANSVASGQQDLVTFTFNQPVHALSASAIVVSDGTLGTISGSGASYTAPATAGSVGTMIISVAQGALSDGHGNALSAAASAQVTVGHAGATGSGTTATGTTATGTTATGASGTTAGTGSGSASATGGVTAGSATSGTGASGGGGGGGGGCGLGAGGALIALALRLWRRERPRSA